MKAIANNQFGSSSSAKISSPIARAKRTSMHCWALNTTTEPEGDRWVMIHTNHHRYFRVEMFHWQKSFNGNGLTRPFLVLKVVLHAVAVISEVLRLSTKSRCSRCCRHISTLGHATLLEYVHPATAPIVSRARPTTSYTRVTDWVSAWVSASVGHRHCRSSFPTLTPTSATDVGQAGRHSRRRRRPTSAWVSETGPTMSADDTRRHSGWHSGRRRPPKLV